MSRRPLTITDYERVPDGVNPPLRYPDYRSSVTRSPDQPLVVASHTLSELTGPVYRSRPIGPSRSGRRTPPAGTATTATTA